MVEYLNEKHSPPFLLVEALPSCDVVVEADHRAWAHQAPALVHLVRPSWDPNSVEDPP